MTEIETQKEKVGDVDFDNQFTDNLPQRAINLGKFMEKLKDKDINSDTKGVIAI